MSIADCGAGTSKDSPRGILPTLMRYPVLHAEAAADSEELVDSVRPRRDVGLEPGGGEVIPKTDVGHVEGETVQKTTRPFQQSTRTRGARGVERGVTRKRRR